MCLVQMKVDNGGVAPTQYVYAQGLVEVIQNSMEFMSVEMHRIGQTHGVCKVFLAGNSPNLQSYTVYKYGAGQL